MRFGTSLNSFFFFWQYKGVAQGSVLNTTIFLDALDSLLSSLPSGIFSALLLTLPSAVDIIRFSSMDGFNLTLLPCRPGPPIMVTFTQKQVIHLPP